MVRLLSILTLILATILFPPATLALISNNAVPGDKTYPIKRGLEDVIYAVVSLNPVTKAWFAAARSDRRFKEFSTLIAQGKSASNTLNELVNQTDIAALEIKKVDDPVKKQALISQLSESINKYDQKLDEVSTTAPSVSTPQPVVVPTPAVTTPKPQINPRPTVAPKATEIPKPSEIERPTPPQGSVSQEDIEDAKKKFEEIKKKLEEEQKKQQEKHMEKKEENRQERNEQKQENQSNKESKPSIREKDKSF